MGRSIYTLLISQTTTNLGFALYTMVVVLHLYSQTGSTTLSAMVTLVSILSRMVSNLCLPFAADRLNLKTIGVGSQVFQVFLLAVLLFLFTQSINPYNLVFIFILLGLISFLNGFFGPIRSSFVKGLIAGDQRVKANSLLASVDQTFLFAGWTFGGLLLAFIGKGATIGVTMVLLMVSICFMVTLPKRESTTLEVRHRFLDQLTIGWKTLFGHKSLRILVIMDLLEAWAGTIWIGAVTLTFVQEALGKGETWWGYINGGYYFGTIVGGLIIFRMAQKMDGKLTTFMIMGSTAFGGLTFLYGFTSHPYLALLLVLFMGPSYQLRDLAQETMFQNTLDERNLAKALATKSMLIQLIFLVSIVGIGALTDLIGVRFIYIGSGCLLMASSIFGFFYLKVRERGLDLEVEYAEGS